jgi:hypothetical protein
VASGRVHEIVDQNDRLGKRKKRVIDVYELRV